MTKDSSRPEFWDERFRDGVTPWDAGGVPRALGDWLRSQAAGKRVLVPGCGSGYEIRLFAERGDEVLGIDFSDAALEKARGMLGSLAGRVRKADWGRKIAELVRPGGRLAGFFYLNDNERGPPFGISLAQLHQLLDGAFRKDEQEKIPAEQSVPVLAGHEVWQVWTRQL